VRGSDIHISHMRKARHRSPRNAPRSTRGTQAKPNC